MFRQSMFLVLGLMAALTLGCEKKQEAPAAPDTDAAVGSAADHADDAADHADDAVKDAAEKVGAAADEVKDAAKDVKIPGQ
jgi:hypothetical protein